LSGAPAALVLFLLSADETPPERPPIPEPILVETITDIDAHRAGEVEYELNTLYMRSREGGAYELEGGPEVEWLATDRLGTILEVFGSRDATGAPPTNHVGVTAGLSWKLLHDFRRDFHLQAEIWGRYPFELETNDPGEQALPFALNLASALQMGRWTLRSTMGVSAGGKAAHVPLQGGAVLLTGLGGSQGDGFCGLEIVADGAKLAPLTLAFDLVPDLTRAGLPFRVGVVGSYAFGAPQTVPSWGVFLRIFVESERENDFAHRAEPPAPGG
jgi:hypothetical protein